MAQMRTLVVGVLAGACRGSRSTSPQWANLANALAAALQAGQGTAAKSMGARSRERQQIVRDRRDVKHIESQLGEATLPRITRAPDDQRRDFATRNSGKGDRDISLPKYKERYKRGNGGFRWGIIRRQGSYQRGNSD